MIDRVNHPRLTGSITGDGPGQSPVIDKEEVWKKREEVTPSSSSKKADDDDEIRPNLIAQRDGSEESKQAAIEAVRKCLGEDAAAIVEGDAEEIALAVGGRWELIEYAAYLASTNSKPIGRPKGWLKKTAGGFPPSGPSVEAKRAKAKVLEQERQRAEDEARWEAQRAEEARAEENALAMVRGIDDASAEELVRRVEATGLQMVFDGKLVRFTRANDYVIPEFKPVFMDRLRALKPQIVAILESRVKSSKEVPRA